MNVSSTALSGLRAVELDLRVAATNTANATTAGFKAEAVVKTTQPQGGVQAEVVSTDNDVSLDEQRVSADIATYNFQANLKVLQTQKKLDKSLLDIQA